MNERDIPVIFTGSFRGQPHRRWSEYPKAIRDILDDVSEYILSEDHVPIEKAVDYVLDRKTLNLSSAFRLKFDQILHYVQFYIHDTRRFQFMKTLGEAGVPVEIYGQGWEEWVQTWKSFTLRAEGTVEETLGLMQRARICLNTNTHFVNGGHERVFSAMGNGAAVVTDSSLYYKEEFIEDNELVMYSWTKLDDAPHKIMNLLNHPEQNWKIACAGRSKVLKKHSWASRVEQFLELAHIHKSLMAIKG